MAKLSEQQKEEIKRRYNRLKNLREKQAQIENEIEQENTAIRGIRKLCDHKNSYCSSPTFAGGLDGYTCRDCGLEFDC